MTIEPTAAAVTPEADPDSVVKGCLDIEGIFSLKTGIEGAVGGVWGPFGLIEIMNVNQEIYKVSINRFKRLETRLTSRCSAVTVEPFPFLNETSP